MDEIREFHEALGAELLHAKLLGKPSPRLGGRYVVEDVLGRGATGLVLAATDSLVDLPVALKVRPALDGDSSMPDEARALLQLDHRNVVRVRGIDRVPARVNGREFTLWLVSMDRLRGQTMRAWLRERKRRPREILKVLADVARGLAAAHDKRIFHRDVKPDNVFVLPDGMAQVLDFGFSIQVTSTQSEVGGVHPAAGTDPYMAPEARIGHATRKSDQFALGVTLVEALTDKAIPAGKRIPAGVPEAVWALAQRATQPEPDDRFDDMTAMADEMARLARGPSRVILGFAVAVLAGIAWVAAGRPAASAPSAPPSATTAADAGTLLDVAPPGAEASTDDAATTDIEAASTGSDDTDVGACSVPVGTYRFQTNWTHGEPVAVTQGAYELGVASQHGDPELRLTRTAPRRDRLWVRSMTYVDDCAIHVSASAENRTYEFWLVVDDTGATGRFEASGDLSFGGTVSALP